MVQKARPVSDVSDSGWTPTKPMFAQVNAVTPTDTTWLQSSGNPVDVFEVQLAGMIWPDVGPETLTVRLRQADSGPPGPVTIELCQGAVVVAIRTVRPGPSFSDFSFVLNDNEVAKITDYSKLGVRVIAGSITIPCCPGVDLPTVLHATLSDSGGAFGSCPAVNGKTATLAYTTNLPNGRAGWLGTFSLCHGTQSLTVQFYCDSHSMAPLGFLLDASGCSLSPDIGLWAQSPTCSPVYAHFIVAVDPHTPCCCGGNTPAFLCDITA